MEISSGPTPAQRRTLVAVVGKAGAEKEISGVFDSAPSTAKELLSLRTVAGFSDGGAHTKFQTMGIYPTDLLTWLVRDTGTLTLEEAHYHLNYMPA